MLNDIDRICIGMAIANLDNSLPYKNTEEGQLELCQRTNRVIDLLNEAEDFNLDGNQFCYDVWDIIVRNILANPDVSDDNVAHEILADLLRD